MTRDRYQLADREWTLVYFEATDTGFRIWRIPRGGDRFYFEHPDTGRVRIDITLDVARLLSKLSAMQC